MPAQQGLDVGSAAIATPDPQNAGCSHRELSQFLKIRILGYDGQAMLQCKTPDVNINRALQACLAHMQRAGKQISQALGQPRRKVLVEQELHAASVN